MKKKWKVLSAVLACLMLTGSLVACGNNTEDPTDTLAKSTVAEEESQELKDWLPDDLNYNGDEITIISRYREGWTSGEISVEKSNGEPVNDAVYERNLVVQDRLGVTIVSIEDKNADQNTVVNLVKKAVQTESDEYDILACACYLMLNESLSGTFANLRNAEYLDFSKPWWSQGFNEVVEYQGLQYGVTGAALLSMYRFAFVTLFNKRLFDEAGISYPYDNVRNGSWTLDYQTSILTTFHRDNGNGTQDTVGDVYGLTTGSYISVDPYWSACDVPILAKDEYGEYQLVFDMERLHSVCDKLMTMFYGSDNATYVWPNGALDAEQEDIRDMFADGNAAMATMRLLELESAVMRDMRDEYGVLPMPKFDETQTQYKTLLHDQFTVLAVPTTIGDDRLTELSAVMEALGSESYKRVKPAYYDTTLRAKLVKDPDSVEMMDIIFDNVYIDAGIIYTSALSSFHDAFRGIMTNKDKGNTVTSTYKTTAKQAQTALNRMAKKLNKLVEKDG